MMIYILDITEQIPEEVCNDWMNFLPDNERLRINRFRSENDRKRSLYGLMAAYSAACIQCGVNRQDLDLKRDERGKPYFDGIEGFYFNISHSGDMVAVMTGNSPVGVDVEHIRETRKEKITAKRIMTPAEYDVYRRIEDTAEGTRLFFRLWTIKECFMKYTGEGISMGPDKIGVSEPEKLPCTETEDGFSLIGITAKTGEYTIGSSMINAEYIISFMPADDDIAIKKLRF